MDVDRRAAGQLCESDRIPAASYGGLPYAAAMVASSRGQIEASLDEVTITKLRVAESTTVTRCGVPGRDAGLPGREFSRRSWAISPSCRGVEALRPARPSLDDHVRPGHERTAARGRSTVARAYTYPGRLARNDDRVVSGGRELRGAGTDESPHATTYTRGDRAHKTDDKVVHT